VFLFSGYYFAEMLKRTNPFEAQRQAAIKRRRTRQSFGGALNPPPPQLQINRGALARFRFRNLPGANYSNIRSTHGELKSLDQPSANFALNSTAVFTCLNLVRAGSSFCNRIGRKINMMSVRMRGWINPIRTITLSDVARILIIYDRQANGANPTLQSLLQTTDQAAGNTTTILSGINLNNRDRFVILRDEMIVLPSQTVTAGAITTPGWVDPVSHTFEHDWYVKMGGLSTQFGADSAPAVIGDITTGALFMVTAGLNAAGAEGYQLTAEVRLRYLDD